MYQIYTWEHLNGNAKTKEKWKNVSDKNVSLIKWVIFGVHIEK